MIKITTKFTVSANSAVYVYFRRVLKEHAKFNVPEV